MLHRAKVVQRSRTLAAYHKIIHEQLQRRFIEKVTDPQSTTGRVHYIPHHAVLKDSSYCVFVLCAIVAVVQILLNRARIPASPLVQISSTI